MLKRDCCINFPIRIYLRCVIRLIRKEDTFTVCKQTAFLLSQQKPGVFPLGSPNDVDTHLTRYLY